MHELSITESVVRTVTDKLGDARVLRVSLEIGKLSGVVADSVRFCFDLVTSGTSLEGARLEVLEPLGHARCRECRSEVELSHLLDVCACGSAELDVLDGDQLRIKEVEVAA